MTANAKPVSATPTGDGTGDDAPGREPRGERPRGNIMRLADSAAGVVAIRHSGRNCVTAAVDHFEFHAPVFIGNLEKPQQGRYRHGTGTIGIYVGDRAKGSRAGVRYGTNWLKMNW